MELYDISFNPNKMEFGWFESNLSITELNIHSLTIESIAPSAFATKAFRSVTSLTIGRMLFQILRPGVFNGLQALENLTIYDIKLHRFENDFLKKCPKIRYISVSRTSEQSLYINGLTGSVSLPNVETVTLFRTNLHHSITCVTFMALKNVSEIILRNNQILYIGANSFDTVMDTLKKLDLSQNYLTTLSDTLFDFAMKIKRKGLKVLLSGNNWQCNCSLEHMRIFLNGTGIESDRPICKEPQHLYGRGLTEIGNLCQSTDYETAVPPENSSKIHVRVRCEFPSRRKSVTFSVIKVITKLEKTIRFDESIDDRINLNVSDLTNDYVVIGYVPACKTSNTSYKELHCFGTSQNIGIEEIRTKIDINMEKFSIFCVMAKNAKEVSPLDCISFWNGPKSGKIIRVDVWISFGGRWSSILFGVSISILSFIAGICVTLVVERFMSKPAHQVNLLRNVKHRSHMTGTFRRRISNSRVHPKLDAILEKDKKPLHEYTSILNRELRKNKKKEELK